MTVPSTSKRELALADIETTLEAVSAGSSYNYTIDRATRLDGPFFVWLDSVEENVAVFIEEGGTAHGLDTHDGLHLSSMEVFIDIAVRYEPDSTSPLEQTGDSKSTIRSKMIGDIIKAMLADHTRSRAAIRTRLTDDGPVNLDFIGDDDKWHPADWVAHELRFEVDYEMNEASP